MIARIRVLKINVTRRFLLYIHVRINLLLLFSIRNQLAPTIALNVCKVRCLRLFSRTRSSCCKSFCGHPSKVVACTASFPHLRLDGQRHDVAHEEYLWDSHSCSAHIRCKKSSLARQYNKNNKMRWEKKRYRFNMNFRTCFRASQNENLILKISYNKYTG